MNDKSGGSDNVLHEAIIALRYKLENEKAYKDFQKAMSALGGAGGLKKTNATVEVNISGVGALKKLRKELQDLSGKVSVSVNPSRRVPITRHNSSGTGTGEPPLINRGVPKPSSGAPIITVDQIKELGSAAKAAAEALRSGTRSSAAGINPSQLRGAIDSSAKSLIGSRSRFDPYAADANLDRLHAAGDLSSLKFNRAAPDLARMLFSPTQGAQRGRVRIPSPDMTVFKRGVESLKEWARQARDKIQHNLEITPRIKSEKGAGSLKDAMATVGVGALVGGFASVMNESQQLSDQIKNLTPNINEAAKAQKALLEAAKQTNASYHGTVDIYSSLAAISDKTKLSTDDNVGITKTIQMASQLGGGSTEGQKRAIVQLEQALQMGKMDGQGINSIESQSRGLAVVLAQGMGKSMADLKQLTKEGKVTAEEITKAFIKMGPEVEKRFAKVGVTLGGLRNYARTVMLEWASKLSSNWDGWAKGMRLIRDAMAGLNNFMSGAFDKLTSVLGSGENAAKAVQYAFLALGGGAVLAAVWAFGGAVLAALWPVVVAAGAVFTAIVAIDDILGWIAGKKSVMGDLVGPFENFKPVFDDISKSFGELGKAWSDLWGGGDGMKDALNQGQEPPLARSFRNMLASIKEIIENVKEMLRLLKALQDGDYGSALDIGGNVVKNGIAPGGDAHGMGWAELLKYAMYGKNPREDPILGWWIKTTDLMTGTKTLPIDERKAQIDAARGMESRQITTNNSPNITIYAGSNDPSEIANKTASAVTNAMRIPMLPNAERGPR